MTIEVISVSEESPATLPKHFHDVASKLVTVLAGTTFLKSSKSINKAYIYRVTEMIYAYIVGRVYFNRCMDVSFQE